MKKEKVCIVCPMSCHMLYEKIDEENYEVEGNICKRGPEYLKKEFTNPTRMLTSTVIIEGGIHRRLPVVTSDEIPKDKIFEVMSEINKIVVKSPIKKDEIVLKNILNLGIDIVSSRNL